MAVMRIYALWRARILETRQFSMRERRGLAWVKPKRYQSLERDMEIWAASEAGSTQLLSYLCQMRDEYGSL